MPDSTIRTGPVATRGAGQPAPEGPALSIASHHRGLMPLGASTASMSSDLSPLARSTSAARRSLRKAPKIGSASCRAGVCQYVSLPAVAVTLKNKQALTYVCTDIDIRCVVIHTSSPSIQHHLY